MQKTDPRQSASIASFLSTSRHYLGLPERRRAPRAHAYLRWLRLALVAGSVGSLFGGVAMAELDTRTARAPERGSQLATVERQARRVESMP